MSASSYARIVGNDDCAVMATLWSWWTSAAKELVGRLVPLAQPIWAQSARARHLFGVQIDPQADLTAAL
jgi:hypothetical protein